MRITKHQDNSGQTGLIVNIKRFAIHDGPGIRTTVFLKGCPLRCIWCENPETQEAYPELMFSERLCTGCRTCKKVCEEEVHSFENDKHLIAFERCTLCGKCLEACPAEALQITGQKMSVDEVMAVLLKDKPFYETSSGGVTISGGEPLAQSEFTLSLLRACAREGIHTILDISGYTKQEVFDKVAGASNMLLFDLKAANSELHRRFTGVGNELILRNLHSAVECGVETVVRIPIIPGFNDDEEELRKMAKIVTELSKKVPVQFLSYHSYGSHKYQALGKKYKMSENIKLSREKLTATKNIFTQEGIKVIDEL